jgi:Holin of 3TMs, for gene-transfer release
MGLDVTGIGAIFDFGRTIIDKIFPDKVAQEKERLNAQIILAKMEQDGDIEKLKASLSTILAEASSADPWTSRARPSFMYVMYVMILAALPMAGLYAFRPDIAANVIIGMQKWLTAIPDSLYTLFGVGYVGYTGARSFEKSKGVAQ